MTMNEIIFSFVYGYIKIHGFDITETETVSRFVSSQINKLPRCFLIGMKWGCYFFEVACVLVYGKRLSSLPKRKLIEVIMRLKKMNIPPLMIVLRFIESTTLLRVIEIEIEERI